MYLRGRASTKSSEICAGTRLWLQNLFSFPFLLFLRFCLAIGTCPAFFQSLTCIAEHPAVNHVYHEHPNLQRTRMILAPGVRRASCLRFSTQILPESIQNSGNLRRCQNGHRHLVSISRRLQPKSPSHGKKVTDTSPSYLDELPRPTIHPALTLEFCTASRSTLYLQIPIQPPGGKRGKLEGLDREK